MYKNTDPAAIAEMERQRLGESVSEHTHHEMHCIICNVSSEREPLYHTRSFGTMCLSCAVRALYQRICDCLDSLDPATLDMITALLDGGDIDFLFREEYTK